MYARLKEYVNSGQWRVAAKELAQALAEDKWDDELAVLAAVIADALGDTELAYDYIAQGLLYNYRNYELYLLLGNYYSRKNVNQAWLCYENAEYYCTDGADLEVILEYKKRIEQNPAFKVNKVAIVVLTYNTKDLNIQCIQSIRNTNKKSSYELVIVDNASTDGTVEWLMNQTDITLICNKENKGFPEGCNQGIKAADGKCESIS